MQHRFFQNFCRLLHELSYKSHKSQSDNAWRSKNKCGALGWPCFNQSWHHWMFGMWVKQLYIKKKVEVPELCVFFALGMWSMILKLSGEALQQQLQEQAELQLQLQQHLEQEKPPVIQLFRFQICRNFAGQLVQITWWLYESYGCWTKASKVILGWDVIWDFLDPGWWLWCQEQQLQRELREQLEREIQVPCFIKLGWNL